MKSFLSVITIMIVQEMHTILVPRKKITLSIMSGSFDIYLLMMHCDTVHSFISLQEHGRKNILLPILVM